MKLLLDQGLPRSTVKHLAAAGVVAEHLGDLGLSRAADDEILAEARQRDAVIVTLDADFHQLLATTRARSPSVVRIRIEGLKGDRLAAIIIQVLAGAQTELATGAVVSVTPGRIRVRGLPIGQK
jgi:predicted nuclease of predicted toxin-antitoxin system